MIKPLKIVRELLLLIQSIAKLIAEWVWLFSLGRYHEAVHAYERANELEPNNDSILQSLEIARKKDLEKSGGAAGGHGHSHGGSPGHGHSHGGAPGGMPDFSGLMNNPGVQNLVNAFQN